MNELKPIEEGCLTLTYNCNVTANNGKVVIVGKFLGKLRGWRHSDYWDTDTSLMSLHGYASTHISQSMLLRIDDPDLKEEEEETTEDINYEH